MIVDVCNGGGIWGCLPNVSVSPEENDDKIEGQQIKGHQLSLALM